MGAVGGLVQSLVDEVKKFFDPVVKLNKRQALTQGVNLGASCVSIPLLAMSCQRLF